MSSLNDDTPRGPLLSQEPVPPTPLLGHPSLCVAVELERPSGRWPCSCPASEPSVKRDQPADLPSASGVHVAVSPQAQFLVD